MADKHGNLNGGTPNILPISVWCYKSIAYKKKLCIYFSVNDLVPSEFEIKSHRKIN